jgi:BMFP domain-containing protein YqiC
MHGVGAAGMRVSRAFAIIRKEGTMLNSKTLDELAARIGKAFEASPAKDIEKNIKAMLQSGLTRLDLVTRQEFEIQAEVLRKTREKVERLEARVAELESRSTTPSPPMV